MSKIAWLAGKLSARRITQITNRHLTSLADAPVRASRRTASNLLETLANDPGPKVHLGETEWGQPVVIPLSEFVRACGTTTGGMGAGKTLSACLVLESMIEGMGTPGFNSMSFGLIDAKGELYERVLFLLARRLAQLDGRAREELLDRIVLIDFSARNAVSPYNILSRWSHTEPDFFLGGRTETLRELLPADEKLSLRGAVVLRNVLALLSEFQLPVTYVSHALDSEILRSKLLARSRNPEVRSYFGRHFAQESKQTIAALRARMESLFTAESVRLALSGSASPDFNSLMSAGRIVLVNCAGKSITRGVRLLLQGLVLSDIRQATFARPNNPPVSYLWLADEAQNFFLTRQQQEAMYDLLTMSRSFGTYFCLLCQNISTAVSDARSLEILHTNIRWSLTMRGSPRDGQHIRAALPVTGRRLRPDHHPYKERTTYSPEEERSLALEGIAHLPDRVGYLWLKTRSPEAIKIETRKLDLPEGEEFRQIVDSLREDPRLGKRIPRSEYERFIAERDREWLETKDETAGLGERFEKRYNEERNAWQA